MDKIMIIGNRIREVQVKNMGQVGETMTDVKLSMARDKEEPEQSKASKLTDNILTAFFFIKKLLKK